MIMTKFFIFLAGSIIGCLFGFFYRILWDMVFSDKHERRLKYIKFLKLEVRYWGESYRRIKKKCEAKTEHEKKIYSHPVNRLSSVAIEAGLWTEFVVETYGVKKVEIDYDK